MSNAATTELKEFDQLAADVALLVEPTLKLTVKSQEDSAVVISTAKDVKTLLKRIEERRMEHTAPLEAKKKSIIALAKKIAEPLEKAEMHLKNELRNWELELEKKRQAELKRLDDERKKREAEAADQAAKEREEAEAVAMFSPAKGAGRVVAAAEASEARVQAEIQNDHAQAVASVQAQRVSGARKVWKFEITDASKVPDAFKIVDERLIRAAVAEGAREIAGVRIYQDVSIAVR